MSSKRLYILALVALTALAASAKVKWLETTHNFGAFTEEMGAVSTDFRFVNTSREPVVIISARASCGCTTPKYTKDPVAPGDTAHIIVSYDPAGRPGRFTKYVGVTLSDKQPMTKLYIKGTVVGSSESVAQRFPADCGTALQLAKGSLMIGELTKGQLRTVFFEAYNRSTDTIVPVVTGLPPYLEASVTPDSVPPGEQASFIFYMHSDRCPLYGIVDGEIEIAPAKGKPGCKVPTVAVVREDFSKLSPKQLEKAPRVWLDGTSVDFGRLGTDVVTRTVAIKNTGKSPLKIRRVYTADAGVTVKAAAETVKPGKECPISITVDPKALPGALLNARISLITNDPDKSVTTIRAVGQL